MNQQNPQGQKPWQKGNKQPKDTIYVNATTPVREDDGHRFSAVATFKKGNQVQKYTDLDFYLEGVMVATIKTDENGVVSFQFTKIKDGRRVMIFVQEHGGNTQSKPVFVNIPDEEKEERLTLSVGKPVKDGKTYKVSAVAILQEKKQPVNNARIIFFCNGSRFVVKQTGPDGVAEVEITGLEPGSEIEIMVKEEKGVKAKSAHVSVPKEEKEKEEQFPEEPQATLEQLVALQNAYTQTFRHCLSANVTVTAFKKWLETLPVIWRVDVIAVLAASALNDTDTCAKTIVDIANMIDDAARTSYAHTTGLIKPADTKTILAFSQLLDAAQTDGVDLTAISRWIRSLYSDQYQILMRQLARWPKKHATAVLKTIAGTKGNTNKTLVAMTRGLIN